MKILAIIRTFPADDYIAYLCYQSFKKVIGCDFIFFAEHGEYKWLSKADGVFMFHDSFGNYGGQLGLNGCINELSKIKTDAYDYVILVDSDIIMVKNPLSVLSTIDFEFGGIMDFNNHRHYSGQLLIFSEAVWRKVITYPNYDWVMDNFLKDGTDIADDTCLSWVATGEIQNIFSFPKDVYWRHEKLHHLEPK